MSSIFGRLQTHLLSQQTSVKQELLAGLSTFFTMAYIVVLAPNMYAAVGMNFAASFLATCLISCAATLIVGLWANLPIGFAPGLGLLSYFCFEVIGQLGYPWPLALGAVLLSGFVFVGITLTRVRHYILIAIPKSLGLAIAAGIGFFIGFIALKNVGVIVSNHVTLVSLGQLTQLKILLFFAGFLLIAILEGYHIKGAILISILLITLIGDLLGLSHFQGLIAWPHFDFSILGVFTLKPLFSLQAFPVLFTFVIIALFDSTGTLLGLTRLIDFKNKAEVDRTINRALLAESFATIGSAFLGATTLSPYIESAAGIKAGGKTGLTALVIALCFLLMLFLSPFAEGIPSFATAGALFYVACLMIKPFAEVAWEDVTELIPAVMTLFIIPLSFSIADGVGIGIITYVALKLAHRRFRDIHPMMWGLMVLFLVYFSL